MICQAPHPLTLDKIGDIITATQTGKEGKNEQKNQQEYASP